MKINRRTTITQNVKYLKATLGVRYWCDCEYSTDGENYIDPCVDDTEEESENMKKMTPLVVNKDIGYKTSDYWEIIIDIDNGKILYWPKNFWLNTHYKICDDGEYVFLDEEGKEVVNITKEYEQYYVPDFISLEDEGYGDYVYLNIDGDGNIEHADWMRDRIATYFNNMNKDE